MKSTALDILIIGLIAIPFLIAIYMHFFIYWDVVLSPKQSFLIYWPVHLPIVIGWVLHKIRKK